MLENERKRKVSDMAQKVEALVRISKGQGVVAPGWNLTWSAIAPDATCVFSTVQRSELWTAVATALVDVVSSAVAKGTDEDTIQRNCPRKLQKGASIS